MGSSRLILLICALGAHVSIVFGQGGAPAANVMLGDVLEQELIEHRAVTGEIRSMMEGEIASQVEGLLVEVLVEEGDEVEAGDVLARLDAVRAELLVEQARARVRESQADVAQREAELALSRRELERLEELDRLGSSGVSQLDAARTAVAADEAELARAESELATERNALLLSERDLADMTIEAPFSGRVVERHLDVGSWVGRGDSLLSLVSLSRLEARVDIPENVYRAVQESRARGEGIELRLPALGRALDDARFGRVVSILPIADSLSRLFPVRISVENGDGLLRPGMSLLAMVPTGERGVYLTVSKDAIVRKATGEVVFYSRDGVAAIAPVERLFTVGDRVVVRSPMLSAGMRVVIDGNERLFPGQALNEIKPAQGAVIGGGVSGGEGGD